MFPAEVVVAKPPTVSDEETERAVVEAFASVVKPVPVKPEIVGEVARTSEPVPVWFVVVKAVPPAIESDVFVVRVPSVEMFPVVEKFPLLVVVAKPLTKSAFETESAVVDALLKMFSAPENVCDARLRSATFEESAESAMDAEGSVSAPPDRVKPFEAVSNPPNVPVPTVAKLPFAVVVAKPLTKNAFETESCVVDALPKVARPVTPSVPEFVVFANAAVPVNVGAAEYTRFPEPVAPVEVMPSKVV